MSTRKLILLLILFATIYVVAFLGKAGMIISIVLAVIFLILLFIKFDGNIFDSIRMFKTTRIKNKIQNENNFFPKEKIKIAVMLSGGVDSAVAAQLLLDKGYEIEAFFMRNWDSTVNLELNNILTEDEICQQEKDYNDAVEVSKKLGIKLHRIDFVKEYWDYVFSVFLKEIEKGLTPNPDILCNRHIKFGSFMNYIKDNFSEFKYVATGHYAKIIEREGVKLLFQARDSFKDQTYFLAAIKKEVLDKLIFPLGDLNKSEVRKIAEESNLSVAKKKDSTGICFIGKRNFPEFISNYLKKNPGKIVDFESGEVVGDHDGVLFYTIGQRKGLNLGGYKKPYFVSGKDVKKNILFVSLGEDNTKLFTNKINAENFNFLVEKNIINNGMRVSFKTRHSEISFDGKITIKGDNVQITSETDIKFVTAGQELVVYYEGVCLGGGIIT